MIRPDFREIKHSEIYHYGIKRRSGRYPWGSGDRPFQSEEASFYRVGDMKPNKSGVLYVSSDKDDAYRYIKNLGPTTLGKLLGMYSDKFNEIKITSPLKEATVDQTMDIVNDVLYKNDDILKTFNDSIHSFLLLNEEKVMKKRRHSKFRL